jgi:hypothetical protein
MTHDDLVYTAALIDGEGSVLLTRHHTTEYRSPAVVIPSTTHCFMAYLKRTFGGTVSTKRVYKKGHSKSWSWAVGHDRAINLLRSVLPYLKHPEKIRRARLIISQYKAVTVRNGRYTKKQLARKIKFERLFLNRSTRTHVND